MKKYLPFIVLTFVFCSKLYAQERFKDKIFANVAVDSVVYGQGNTFDGKLQQLKIDIYQPEGDAAVARPLIILVHGGAFLTNNSRRDAEIVQWSKAFAQRGYVCVSLQYRLGIVLDFAKLTSEFSSAVWRATLDFREATKYLKSKSNIYKIDTNQIFGIGISAGAIAMLHAQMLDLPEELNASNPKIDTAGKSLVFNRELASFSPKIKGIINLSGAIGNVEWMKNNTSCALLNIHGDKDLTIPYKTDFFKAGPFPIARVSGGFSIDSMARILKMDAQLYTFKGAGHAPFSPRLGNLAVSNAYLDTTENLMVDFLFKRILNSSLAVQGSLDASHFNVFPNPAKELLNVQFLNTSNYEISISNMLNQNVLSIENRGVEQLQINLSPLPAGVYTLQFKNNQGRYTRKLLVE